MAIARTAVPWQHPCPNGICIAQTVPIIASTGTLAASRHWECPAQLRDIHASTCSTHTHMQFNTDARNTCTHARPNSGESTPPRPEQLPVRWVGVQRCEPSGMKRTSSRFPFLFLDIFKLYSARTGALLPPASCLVHASPHIPPHPPLALHVRSPAAVRFTLPFPAACYLLGTTTCLDGTGYSCSAGWTANCLDKLPGCIRTCKG